MLFFSGHQMVLSLFARPKADLLTFSFLLFGLQPTKMDEGKLRPFFSGASPNKLDPTLLDGSGYLVFALLGGISAAIGSAVFRLTGLRGVWGIGVQSLQVPMSYQRNASKPGSARKVMRSLKAGSIGSGQRCNDPKSTSNLWFPAGEPPSSPGLIFQNLDSVLPY